MASEQNNNVEAIQQEINNNNDIDNIELLKINNSIEPISSDEEDINNSNNSNKSTFADKVKGKKERDRERPLSWAEQAIIPLPLNNNPPSNENSENSDGEEPQNEVFDSENNESPQIENQEDNQQEDYQQEDYQQEVYQQEDNLQYFINDISDKLYNLETKIKEQDNTILQQSEIINSLSNKIYQLTNKEFYLQFIFAIHLKKYIESDDSDDNNGDNNNINDNDNKLEALTKFIDKKIKICKENKDIVKFCDFDSETGEITCTDYKKLFTFITNLELTNNQQEDSNSILYWINKCKDKGMNFTLDKIIFKYICISEHENCDLNKIFSELKNQSKFEEQLLQQVNALKEQKKKKKQYKPRFYINSKEIKLDTKTKTSNIDNTVEVKDEVEDEVEVEVEVDVDVDDNVDDDTIARGINEELNHNNVCDEDNEFVDFEGFEDFNNKFSYNKSRIPFNELSLEEQEAIIKDRSNKDCYNFLRGHCTRGDACHYKHDYHKRREQNYKNNKYKSAKHLTYNF